MPNKAELEYGVHRKSRATFLKGKEMKKVYLKDLQPDEIIRRLKAGEVVKSGSEIIKWIDGILCTLYNDGEITYNPLISVSKNSSCYFEEPEELKLEVGKCYRTRDGRKAFISVVDDMYAYGIIEGNSVVTTWGHNGVCDTDDDGGDIISEWSDDDVAED